MSDTCIWLYVQHVYVADAGRKAVDVCWCLFTYMWALGTMDGLRLKRSIPGVTEMLNRAKPRLRWPCARGSH